MVDIVRQTDKEPLWIRYIRQRINQNKNVLAIISGPTGSGKSWTGLSIGEMVDPNFNVERVIFSGKELMNLINSGKLGKKKGVFILWDEAGVDLSNRNWQSLANKMLNFLMQTFRHRCFVLLFTAPYSDFVDKATRKLFHAELRTISIDYEKKTVKIKPQLIQYNSRMGKFYYKYLRVITNKDGVVPIVEWNVKAPSKKLIEEYETKKNRFTAELNRNIERQLNRIEAKKNPKPLTELQEKILVCWNKGIFNQYKIGEIVDRARQQIALNEKWMRGKGYDKMDYKSKCNSNLYRNNQNP